MCSLDRNLPSLKQVWQSGLSWVSLAGHQHRLQYQWTPECSHGLVSDR